MDGFPVDKTIDGVILPCDTLGRPCKIIMYVLITGTHSTKNLWACNPNVNIHLPLKWKIMTGTVTILPMPPQLNCRDMCKFGTWLDRYNKEKRNKRQKDSNNELINYLGNCPLMSRNDYTEPPNSNHQSTNKHSKQPRRSHPTFWRLKS